jgi:acetyl-CoA carboxylase alpha subunit
MKAVGKAIDNALLEFSTMSADKIKEMRQQKFLNMGSVGL